MAMPQAAGRFHRVIAESGVALKAITTGRRQRDRLHADDPAGHPATSGSAAAGSVHANHRRAGADGPGGPFRTGAGSSQPGLRAMAPFDPVAPSISANVPMILGSTLTEITFLNTTPLDPIDDATLRADLKRTLAGGRRRSGKTDRALQARFPRGLNVRLYQIIASDNWLTANVALTAERKAALGTSAGLCLSFRKAHAGA